METSQEKIAFSRRRGRKEGAERLRFVLLFRRAFSAKLFAEPLLPSTDSTRGINLDGDSSDCWTERDQFGTIKRV